MSEKNNDTYIYRIDEHDNIVFVSENWSGFASDNNASEACFAPAVLGQSLWEFIADNETIHLYQLMIDRVRKKDKTVSIGINCDSPDLRRFMKITISSYAGKQIEFISKIIQTEKRDFLPILSKSATRSDDLIRICSYCKKIALDKNNWVETEKAVDALKLFQKDKMPMMTHGVCPSCYETVMSEIKNEYS